MADENKPVSKSLQLGLSFMAGGGIICMVIALGVGVVSGDSVDATALNLLFALGAAALIAGILAWFLVVRPDTHFDDINQPMFTGHHDEH